MTENELITIDPRVIKHLPTANPNVMEPRMFEQLVKNIRTHGFLQPVLVVSEGGEFVLVDGVHRAKAAVEVGLETITAIAARDRAHAEVLRIAMNKLRGELDLSEVGIQMHMLQEMGLTVEELETTGFADYEIESLLSMINNNDSENLDGVDPEPPAPTPPKTYALTIRFDTESERARLREALEAVGDGDLREGIEAALDSASPDWRAA